MQAVFSCSDIRLSFGADCILAEDTRHSRKLLSYFGISTQLYSFHEHNEHAKEAQVSNPLPTHTCLSPLLHSNEVVPRLRAPAARKSPRQVIACYPEANVSQANEKTKQAPMQGQRAVPEV